MMRLTQTVKKGGCAAKVAAHELRRILDGVRFPKPQDPLIINGSDFDDACIYRLNDTTSLVKTLDFFTPIVDSPYLFGQIAAANAMSDVYAMGGYPVLALAILAFPVLEFEDKVVTEVLQGAIDKLSEANADLAGGHSIDDDTLKFGLSVTGLVDNLYIWTNAGARAGDKIILTKALGTGTLMASLKNDKLSEAALTEAFDSMSALNNTLDLLTDEDRGRIHAATDVTGFGLAGHGLQMARASHVSLKISRACLPILEHAIESLTQGVLTKAHRTNREYTEGSLEKSLGLTKEDELIFFDPQTSGGLLLTVDATHSGEILDKIKTRFPRAAIIGEVIPRTEKYLCYEQ